MRNCSIGLCCVCQRPACPVPKVRCHREDIVTSTHVNYHTEAAPNLAGHSPPSTDSITWPHIPASCLCFQTSGTCLQSGHVGLSAHKIHSRREAFAEQGDPDCPVSSSAPEPSLPSPPKTHYGSFMPLMLRRLPLNLCYSRFLRPFFNFSKLCFLF